MRLQLGPGFFGLPILGAAHDSVLTLNLAVVVPEPGVAGLLAAAALAVCVGTGAQKLVSRRRWSWNPLPRLPR